jgi:hypothetical protein
MRNAGPRLAALCLLLIPILACSPRSLLRFVRGLAGAAAALPASDEMSVVRLNSSAKTTGAKAIPQRPLKVRSTSSVVGPPQHPDQVPALPRAFPLHFPGPFRAARKVELLKPSYLQAFHLGVSRPLPPG